MRFKFSRAVTLVIFLLNGIAFYFLWQLLSYDEELESVKRGRKVLRGGLKNDYVHKNLADTVQQNVTVVFREFENFENDLPNSVRSVTSTYPNISILIVSNSPPYPPLLFDPSQNLYQNVKQVYLEPSLTNSFKSRSPLCQITTSYVLFMPDSTRIHTKKTIEKMLKILRQDEQRIVAATFKASRPVVCYNLHINQREWVIQFEETLASLCDYVKGKHSLLVKSDILRELSDPFMLPFPDAFYIQAAAKGIKTFLLNDLPFGSGKELYRTPHNHWKAERLDKERTYHMFRSLGLKKVIRGNGVVEWYGCRRDTVRCFGTVIEDTPDYLWEGKWTPPCCLAGLRRTARHVFQQLEQAQARYWLEGGSLLGAVRGGDILPWDYDVDIGIYKEDIPRCAWLLRAKSKTTTDEQGFIWEKAVEGDFFRVHFSHINHLHVDIFPFYSKNGTMTKDSWFKSHKQDKEFPEHFLKPLSSIDFVGRSVSAPNNIHDFLELKFGEGAIENPLYPNPKKMARLGYKTAPDKQWL